MRRLVIPWAVFALAAWVAMLILFTGQAGALPRQIHIWQENRGALISGASINAEVSTGTIDVWGFSHVALLVAYTFDAGDGVEMRCDGSTDGVTWHKTQAELISSPPKFCTSELVWVHDEAASGNWIWILEPHYPRARCRFIATGSPTVDDLATVTVIVGVVQ